MHTNRMRTTGYVTPNILLVLTVHIFTLLITIDNHNGGTVRGKTVPLPKIGPEFTSVQNAKECNQLFVNGSVPLFLGGRGTPPCGWRREMCTRDEACVVFEEPILGLDAICELILRNCQSLFLDVPAADVGEVTRPPIRQTFPPPLPHEPTGLFLGAHNPRFNGPSPAVHQLVSDTPPGAILFTGPNSDVNQVLLNTASDAFLFPPSSSSSSSSSNTKLSTRIVTPPPFLLEVEDDDGEIKKTLKPQTSAITTTIGGKRNNNIITTTNTIKRRKKKTFITRQRRVLSNNNNKPKTSIFHPSLSSTNRRRNTAAASPTRVGGPQIRNSTKPNKKPLLMAPRPLTVAQAKAEKQSESASSSTSTSTQQHLPRSDSSFPTGGGGQTSQSVHTKSRHRKLLRHKTRIIRRLVPSGSRSVAFANPHGLRRTHRIIVKMRRTPVKSDVSPVLFNRAARVSNPLVRKAPPSKIPSKGTNTNTTTPTAGRTNPAPGSSLFQKNHSAQSSPFLPVTSSRRSAATPTTKKIIRRIIRRKTIRKNDRRQSSTGIVGVSTPIKKIGGFPRQKIKKNAPLERSPDLVAIGPDGALMFRSNFFPVNETEVDLPLLIHHNPPAPLPGDDDLLESGPSPFQLLTSSLTVVDYRSNCCRWTVKGECNTNPSYMRRFCQAECQTFGCQNDPTTQLCTKSKANPNCAVPNKQSPPNPPPLTVTKRRKIVSVSTTAAGSKNDKKQKIAKWAAGKRTQTALETSSTLWNPVKSLPTKRLFQPPAVIRQSPSTSSSSSSSSTDSSSTSQHSASSSSTSSFFGQNRVRPNSVDVRDQNELDDDSNNLPMIADENDDQLYEFDENGHEEFCIDRHSSCPGWAARGECRSNRVWMLDNCLLSCRRCRIHLAVAEKTGQRRQLRRKSKGKLVCKDHHQFCQFWAGGGECKVNKDWMTPNCCNSCRLQIRQLSHTTRKAAKTNEKEGSQYVYARDSKQQQKKKRSQKILKRFLFLKVDRPSATAAAAAIVNGTVIANKLAAGRRSSSRSSTFKPTSKIVGTIQRRRNVRPTPLKSSRKRRLELLKLNRLVRRKIRRIRRKIRKRRLRTRRKSL